MTAALIGLACAAACALAVWLSYRAAMRDYVQAERRRFEAMRDGVDRSIERMKDHVAE